MKRMFEFACENGHKTKDSVIMRRRVLGANAEKQPTAYSVRQPLGWRGGLDPQVKLVQ